MHACVFGANGGIGAAIATALEQRHPCATVHRVCRSGAGRFAFDLLDEASIAAAASAVGRHGTLDLVFVATGILQQLPDIAPEKTLRALDPDAMARVYAVNTIGPALIAKHFAPLLARDRRSVFAAISARVGSIADNRLGGWHSYRASKAALNMILRNLATELRQRHPLAIVAALHPGTVDTPLSQPFQRNVPEGKLFTPDFSAGAMLDTLDRLTPEQSGGLFAWDGTEIPF